MTSTHESALAPQILKTDQRGRVRTPAKRREAILDEFERSAMSAQAFAKQCGIKYSTFASWVQRRERGRARPAHRISTAVTFVEAEVPRQDGAVTTGAIELESPEGFKVRLHGREQIALAVECLRALGGRK